ncbi:poly hydrolase [Roridomyces roridus]|uniref:Poly hydrolase n=1 Tax=Roridomyces roridus TaxID=1738132 RepID=A0AAD7FGY3_9AGAR|nr:poly hydrolase [Roridomyces roridus]
MSSSLDKTAKRMLTGKTPFFACTEDPRFSFGLYVPKSHDFDGPRLPLLVVVHGTRRQTGGYINQLQRFSEQHRIVIFCPLFPAGIIEPFDVHNYKGLLYKDIRFDLVLLAMLKQAAETWKIDISRFFLHGFSGGGQFAHRFLYIHPTRLRGVSIGAPGSITRPTKTHVWPADLGDAKEVFAIEPDFALIAKVEVQVLVGEKDTDTSMLSRDDITGATRVDRAKYLHGALVERGVSATLSVVPGVAHEGIKCLSTMERWLSDRI